MDDYDPSEFRLTGSKIIGAWLAAAIFTIVMAVALSFTEPARDEFAFAAPDRPAKSDAPTSAGHDDSFAVER